MNIHKEFSEKVNLKEENPQGFRNFESSNFNFKGKEFTMSIAMFTNMIFVIITQNGRLGSFYLGEKESDESNAFIDEEGEEMLVTTNCLLGNRKDEANAFLCECIIKRLFKACAGNLEKINKVLLSTTIKFEEIIKTIKVIKDTSNELDWDTILQSNEYKQFMDIILLKVLDLLKKIIK